MTQPRQVTSVRGLRYPLGHELGRGGQGAVFAVEGERLAVKLLFGHTTRLRERLRDQLAMVARLPLNGLAVVRPIDQLRSPNVGYVMELLTGMAPLCSLLQPPKGVASVTQWYLDGGSIGRRLRLLAHVANAVSVLHGRGLIYADLSPHNVFVSENADKHEVRLIDIDNLHPATATGRMVYTPRYGAPEVVRQSSQPSTLADAYSFAVLAFEALALAHPLLGDAVRDGEPELEESAFAGELPWIDAPDDDRNRSSGGIPRSIVLSPVLRENFQATFGLGLLNPEERPGLVTWAEHLHRAADRTILCPSCSGSYFVTRDACPWCEAGRPDCLVARATLWDPCRPGHTGETGGTAVHTGVVTAANGRERVLDQVVISKGRTMQLTKRVTHGISSANPTLSLKWVEKRVTVVPLSQATMYLVSSDGKINRSLEEPVDLPIASGRVDWRIHLGASDRLHRIIRLDLRKGSA